MKKLLFIVAATICLAAKAQNSLNLYEEINKHFSNAGNNFWISHSHTDKKNITHVYLKQTYNNLEIFNVAASIHFKNGIVVNKTGEFVNPVIYGKNITFKLDLLTAIKTAANDKNLLFENVSFKDVKHASLGRFEIKNLNTSTESIFGKQGFLYENGYLKPVWQVEIYDDATNNWWCMYIDANSGEKLSESTYTAHCSVNEIISTADHNDAFYFEDENTYQPFLNKKNNQPQYNTFSLPYENPKKGNRSILGGIDDAEASPFGWHDTNGVSGPDLMVTRGNNVFAKEDTLARNLITGYSPRADSNFVFDFFFDDDARPRENLDAAITNLFV